MTDPHQPLPGLCNQAGAASIPTMPSVVRQGREESGEQCQNISVKKTTRANPIPPLRKPNRNAKEASRTPAISRVRTVSIPHSIVSPTPISPHRFCPDKGEAKKGGQKRAPPGRSRAWLSPMLLSEIWAGGEPPFPRLPPHTTPTSDSMVQRGPQKKMSGIGRPSQPSLWRRGKAGWQGGGGPN